MKKIETYNPEEPIEEIHIPNHPKLKLFFWTLGTIFVATFLALAVVSLGISPQFLTDQACLKLQNESFTNGTQSGLNQGKLIGAIEISQGVFESDILPEFYSINDTTIGFNMINMTDYCLNKFEINNG